MVTSRMLEGRGVEKERGMERKWLESLMCEGRDRTMGWRWKLVCHFNLVADMFGVASGSCELCGWTSIPGMGADGIWQGWIS